MFGKVGEVGEVGDAGEMFDSAGFMGCWPLAKPATAGVW